MSELHWLGAAELCAAYARGSTSPVEVVQALLARIAALDDKLHAFLSVDADGALEAARRAEREIRAGRALGPLHGVPVGIKDIIDIAGQRTSCQSKIMGDHVAHSDAHVVAALRAAGAIVLGKLTLFEFAMGGPSFDLPFPPARNPWNTAFHCGGSSSGSGAAVAGGLVPLALGTDTGGSIRNPAGMCGVVGLKPTYGLVSRRGVFPLAFSMDHVGPMTRTVADAAHLLAAIAGHDPQDAGSAAVAPRSFTADLHLGARGLRIGFVRHFHERDMIAAPEMAAALDEAARALAAEGAVVQDVELPPLQDFAAVQRVISGSEIWSVHGRWLRDRPQDYAANSRRKLMPGAFYSAADLMDAQRLRPRFMRAVDAALQEVDVLLCANSMETACAMDDVAELLRTHPRQARAPFNLTGHPALVMMSGVSGRGLPLSLQFVGRAFDEPTVLRAGAAYERATRWASLRPAGIP
ncbi:MAG: amidase [Burkholderiaceae bacterium]